MCQICTCFGWGLDILQRLVTMCMVCFMCIVICIGMLAVICAGIAYGYNFFLAEFLDYKRADVTVYVRRGQFADRPEVRPIFRRSGQGGGDDTDNELFASNYSIDYQDQSPHLTETKPLANSWQKVQETKNYAERLTKYETVGDSGGGGIRHRAEDEEEKPMDMQPQSEDVDLSLAPRPTKESKNQQYKSSRHRFETEDQRGIFEEPTDFMADPYDQANLPAMRAEDVKRYFSRNITKDGLRREKIRYSGTPNSTESLDDNELEQDFSGYKPV